MDAQHLEELKARFRDLLNYDSEDVLKPIDPLNYRTPEGDNCLHIAAVRGDVRAIELLLDAGVDVDAIGDMGYTALHHAVSQCNVEAAKLLLRRGASPSIKNEFGQTPRDCAKQLGKIEMMKLFENFERK